MSEYRTRIIDESVKEMLTVMGAIQIKGPKWCGKTSTGRQHANSTLFLQDPDEGPHYLEVAALKPSLLLEGDTPRLVDEWQMAPQLWDAVRFVVDQRGIPGQFILTESSVPTVYGTHSGIGRIFPLVMRTMTLYESGESSGQVSLKALLDGEKDIAAIAALDVEDIARVICRGGWPASVVQRSPLLDKVPGYLAQAYVSSLVDSDISRIDGVRRRSDTMSAVMRSLARHVSTQALNATIAADLAVNDASISPNTLSDYLGALDRAYVTENLTAWNPQLRSRTAVRTSMTRHFVDPSIGTAIMRWSPQDLLRDTETLGQQFESLCVRDIRVYAQANDATVHHYRDKTGLEADIVITTADGRWAPLEVKLGSRQLDEAASHLKKLADRVDTDRMGQPAFLGILTAGKTAYRRDDGVLVLPLSCLRP